MITTINEFLFTKHYISDSDNRFKIRIKNAQILNTNLPDLDKAEKRLKRVLYYYALGLLDNMAIAIQPIAVTFGNLYFESNNRLFPCEIKIDKSIIGNVYTAIIKEQEVVTILLHPITFSNQDIYDKIYKHDGTQIKQLRDINGSLLSFDDKKRSLTKINLDISDEEFNKKWSYVNIKNNNITKATGLSQIELEEILNPKQQIEEVTRFIDIPKEFNQVLTEKEGVVFSGETILINEMTINNDIKSFNLKNKKIEKLIIDKTGSVTKYSLKFIGDNKIMPLNKDMSFIIKPKVLNTQTKQLLKQFNIEESDFSNVYFRGTIQRLSYYSQEKTKSVEKLGVIIKPRDFIKYT